jgi:hypothetical protein
MTKNPIISASQCNAILHKGTHGFLIQLFQLTEEVSRNTNLHILRAKVQWLLKEYQDIFVAPSGLPPARGCDHKIIPKEGTSPPNTRPYRLPPKQKYIVEKLIKEILAQQEIRHSSSPYCSPAIVVAKKDKSWRLCNDFRQLNAITIKNKYPIHVIEDLLDELNGATIFSKLDLRSGYHQIRMSETDICKIAFWTHTGHYEYLVMPFGLTNAPATFQELMNTVFAQFLRKIVLVFFDDTLVYRKNEEEHVQHLQSVLQALRQHQLKAKMSKCVLCTPQVEYLGHIISSSRVATGPTKIEDILKWKSPTTIT